MSVNPALCSLGCLHFERTPSPNPFKPLILRAIEVWKICALRGQFRSGSMALVAKPGTIRRPFSLRPNELGPDQSSCLYSWPLHDAFASASGSQVAMEMTS